MLPKVAFRASRLLISRLQTAKALSCLASTLQQDQLTKFCGIATCLRTTPLTNAVQLTQQRHYGDGFALDRQSIGDRVMLNLRLFDKIDPEKANLESRFKEDLGLDSLDHVEIVMAIEDEFGFEIPDQDAEHLHTPALIVQYIMDKLDVLDTPAH